MRRACVATRCHTPLAVTESRMQDDSPDDADHLDDPHDDSFADAPPDPEFLNERRWIDAGTAKRGQPLVFAEPVEAIAAVGTARFAIDWVDQHREASYPADPTYLNGSAIDVALDAPRACRVELPCPAARCGLWVVTCRACGYAIALATAGRADDPRSVRVPCRVSGTS
jgi:hypothetical protein